MLSTHPGQNLTLNDQLITSDDEKYRYSLLKPSMKTSLLFRAAPRPQVLELDGSQNT